MKAFGIFLNSEKGRTRFVLYSGLIFNISVILFKTFTGIAYRSVWFGAMAVYYFLLSVIKFVIIRTDRKLKKVKDGDTARLAALLTFRRCGALLMILNLLMTAIILFVIKYDKKAEYSGFVLWAFGVYTLGRSVVSALNIRHLRGFRDPLIAASRYLGISVTLMSIFSLATVLFDRFCNDDGVRKFWIQLLGFAVCVSVVVIAVSMIVSASRRIKNE